MTGGHDSEIKLWIIGKQTQMLNMSMRVHKTAINQVKFVNDDKAAVSSSIDGQILMWDLTPQKGMKPLRQLATLSIAGSVPLMSFEYNYGANEIVTCGMDKKVQFISLADHSIRNSMIASEEGFEVTAMGQSPDSLILALGYENGAMRLFTQADCRLIHQDEQAHGSSQGGVGAIAVSPDNTLIVTADLAGHIYFWRV